MICHCCQQKRDPHFFLAQPKKVEHYSECVFCMRDQYQNLAQFLQQAAQSTHPAQYIESVSGPLKKAGYTLTCVEKQLSSIEQLKQAMFDWQMHPSQQDRVQNLIRFELSCVMDDHCAFSAVAMETVEEGAYTLQILHPHSCKGGNFQRELQEIRAFNKFSKMMSNWLPTQKLYASNQLPCAYRQVSQVYKKLQNELHDLEDEAVKQVWGLPCRWRRGRGEANQQPQSEDLTRLQGIVQQRQLGQHVCDYINAGFNTEAQSAYFQQRGYFILLACASPELMNNILTSRIQVLLYAMNLLDNNMFLLCRQRLNCTVLRNHVWMIVLLILALRARNGQGLFPLMGVSEPIDSEDADLYEKIEKLETLYHQS